MVDLMYDLTNMYLVRLKITTIFNGRDPNSNTTITKCLLVERQTTMAEFYHETACLPIVMQGLSLDSNYESVAYAIEDNRLDM